MNGSNEDDQPKIVTTGPFSGWKLTDKQADFLALCLPDELEDKAATFSPAVTK